MKSASVETQSKGKNDIEREDKTEGPERVEASIVGGKRISGMRICEGGGGGRGEGRGEDGPICSPPPACSCPPFPQSSECFWQNLCFSLFTFILTSLGTLPRD
ncbi:hypothetical protein PV325_013549 [Microctonus aethiopoides]|nr:hypothetical protein PV325_013549 [Microctonus aethiopoides]KAK0094106.1 hypothetical protein PV326_011810 [Microctonus aethiopoides]